MNYGYGMPAYVNRARLDVQWTDVKATNWTFVYDQIAQAIGISSTGLFVYIMVIHIITLHLHTHIIRQVNNLCTLLGVLHMDCATWNSQHGKWLFAPIVDQNTTWTNLIVTSDSTFSYMKVIKYWRCCSAGTLP